MSKLVFAVVPRDHDEQIKGFKLKITRDDEQQRTARGRKGFARRGFERQLSPF